MEGIVAILAPLLLVTGVLRLLFVQRKTGLVVLAIGAPCAYIFETQPHGPLYATSFLVLFLLTGFVMLLGLACWSR